MERRTKMTAKEWSKTLLWGGGNYVEAQHEKVISDAMADAIVNTFEALSPWLAHHPSCAGECTCGLIAARFKLSEVIP